MATSSPAFTSFPTVANTATGQIAEEEMDMYGLGHGTLGRTGNHKAFVWTRSSGWCWEREEGAGKQENWGCI